MKIPECRQLDDYLDGVLSGEHRGSFRRHLDRCPACRQAVSFEALLVEAAGASSERVVLPPAVRAGAKQAIGRWQRKRRLVWISGVAAALIVGCVLTYSMRSGRRVPDAAVPDRHDLASDEADRTIEGRASNAESLAIIPGRATPTSSDDKPPTTSIRLRSDDAPQQVAVSLPTRNENVTIVMLYPAITKRLSNVERPFRADDAENKTEPTPSLKGLSQ